MVNEADRELLKLAAKAADVELWHEEVFTNGLTRKVSKNGILQWNPLADDGDALRLAVKLGISVSTPDDGDQVASATHWSLPLFLAEKSGDDACAATRRAIVRAAAEIGRRMP